MKLRVRAYVCLELPCGVIDVNGEDRARSDVKCNWASICFSSYVQNSSILAPTTGLHMIGLGTIGAQYVLARGYIYYEGAICTGKRSAADKWLDISTHNTH